jgi:hypothetical protein
MPTPRGHLHEYTQTMSGVPRMVWPGDERHVYQQKTPITVAYSETTWGKLIIDVDFSDVQ